MHTQTLGDSLAKEDGQRAAEARLTIERIDYRFSV
jgi:hypothetical protein